MDNVVQFGRRQAPPPPPRRESRVRHLGVRWPGILGTINAEEMRPDGIDWVLPFEIIAVRHGALLCYGRKPAQRHKGLKPAND